MPPLVAETPEKITEALKFLVPTEEEWQAAARWMELEEGEARDNLLMAKHQQAVQANRHCRADPQFKVGDKVLFDTRHIQQEYKTTHPHGNSTKFIP